MVSRHGTALCTLAVVAAASAPPFVLLPAPAGGLPLPTPQQLKYQGSMNALIHFGMSTFFHDGEYGVETQVFVTHFSGPFLQTADAAPTHF